MAKNYYEILGVDKKASQDEIKSAYRKLVKQYHPDLHPNDPEAANRFKEINEANETLSDPKKRSSYDYELENPGASNFGGFSGQGFGGFGDFGDIFSDLFSGFSSGSSSRTNAKEKGDDVTIEVELSFLDAAKGCSKTVNYSRREPCSHCNGTGAKGGTAYKTCQTCGGSGQVQYVSSGMFRMVSVKTCPDCHGSGKIITDKCDYCSGKGWAFGKEPTSVKLDIPAGADTNSYIKKRGFGHASKNGGEAGDLIVVFKVAQHKIFKRKNYDLYVDLPVSYATCVLGGKVYVPTLDDTTVLDIPAGTQSGKTFAIRGKGIKSTRMGTGTLYVTVNVEIPTGLSRAQRHDLEEFNESIELKQTSKMKEYSNNMQSLYGEDPYKKTK